MGVHRRETKAVTSGRSVAICLFLSEGHVLLAQYFPDGALVITFNHYECQLPAQAVALFGVSLNAADDEYTFATTLASERCGRSI